MVKKSSEKNLSCCGNSTSASASSHHPVADCFCFGTAHPHVIYSLHNFFALPILCLCLESQERAIFNEITIPFGTLNQAQISPPNM